MDPCPESAEDGPLVVLNRKVGAGTFILDDPNSAQIKSPSESVKSSTVDIVVTAGVGIVASDP